jgi:hypothetical protein
VPPDDHIEALQRRCEQREVSTISDLKLVDRHEESSLFVFLMDCSGEFCER